MGKSSFVTALKTLAVPACWLAALPFIAACPGSLDNIDLFLNDGGGLIAVDAGPEDTGVEDAGNNDGSVLVGQCDYVVADILSSNSGCATANCHSTNAPTLGVDLESADIIGRLSGQSASGPCADQQLVNPANPEQSLIYTILLDVRPCARTRMPIGPALPAADVACVLTWLQENVSE